jgi:hypothetical protein
MTGQERPEHVHAALLGKSIAKWAHLEWRTGETVQEQYAARVARELECRPPILTLSGSSRSIGSSGFVVGGLGVPPLSHRGVS